MTDEQHILDLENRIKDLESLVYSMIGSSQYQFQRDIKLYDGRNIQAGYQSGTKIGTSPTQKLGFYGKTPVTQPARPTDLPTVITLLTYTGLSQ